MPSNFLRSIAASFFLLLMVFFPFSYDGGFFQFVFATDDGWSDYDNYIVIDHNETWSGEKAFTDATKPIVVVNGATLTIEKGAHIKLGSLIVYDGKIVALGTEKEKIVFTKQKPDFSHISPEDLAQYDNKCFMGESGMIEFSDWVETADEESSFFRYVEFEGMGTYLQYDSDNCPAVSMNNNYFNIFNTAQAESLTTYNPAIRFNSGRLRIENSSFKNNFYSDIEANLEFNSDQESYDYLHIINSNFEKNAQNTALISQLKYVGDQTKDYSYRVLLKNNWYGDSFGPREMPDYLLGGEKIIGKYKLEGKRQTNLVADPLIIVPGIAGSAQVSGQWKLDPITHTYDDLIDSLKENGYEENINLFSFPYEWRNINATSALSLQTKIDDVLDETKVSKVDIAAHSMGGLVARAYIEEIGGTQYENIIDQLITLGTPHRGSPEAYLKWEAGEGFFTWKDKLARHHFEQEAEEAGYDNNLKGYIQDKVISVKELLPDKNYLFDISANQMREYPDNYPKNSFLEDLNNLDAVQKLNGIRFTNIVGKSKTTNTLSKIRVVDSTKDNLWEHGMPENFYNTDTDQGLEYGNGDETVPSISAKDIIADNVIEIESAHGDLPTKAQCKIFSELTGKLESECEYDEDIHIPNILLFNVFSPVDIQVISPSDKKTGKNLETGEIYNEIPGAYYTGYNTDNEFITIPNPENGEYIILTQGTGEGAYRIEAVKIIEGAEPNQEAKESTATLTGTAASGVTEEKKIELLPDDTVVPKEDEQDNDTIAPIITISSPENKSYLNNEILTIAYSVIDNISPNEKITKEVKLDGIIFSETTIDLSLQTLGQHTFAVRAEDEAGNSAEQSVNFENTTSFDSLKKNIDHYFSLGLIKKKGEAKYIQAFLSYLEKLQETINHLERMRHFPLQYTARLKQKFQRELEHRKKEFDRHLKQRAEKGIIDINAKDRILEAVEKLLQ